MLAVTYAESAPRLHEFPVARELADARRRAALDALRKERVRGHPLAVMSVGHVDAAVWSDDDIVGLVELAVSIARFAGDAQTQQLLALWTELMNLMTLGACLVAGKVGNPDIALRVDVNAVREHEHACTEAGDQLAGLIELEDDVVRRGLAGRRVPARVGAAALGHPDELAVRRDVDRARRSPRAAFRQLEEALNRLVRVRQIVGWRRRCLREERRAGERNGRERRPQDYTEPIDTCHRSPSMVGRILSGSAHAGKRTLTSSTRPSGHDRAIRG